MAIINNAYLASCALTAIAGLSVRSKARSCWWIVLSVGLLILALFRIAQAGPWMDDSLRRALYAMGLYDDRRALQLTSIMAFAVAMLVGLRSLPPISGLPLGCAICAFYLLTLSMAIRSSSLHWTDAVFREQVGSIGLSYVIQMTLLLAMSAAALFQLYLEGAHRRRANDR